MRPKWLLIKSYLCEVCVTCILVHLYSLLLVMMGSRQLLNVCLCSCNSNCCNLVVVYLFFIGQDKEHFLQKKKKNLNGK